MFLPSHLSTSDLEEMKTLFEASLYSFTLDLCNQGFSLPRNPRASSSAEATLNVLHSVLSGSNSTVNSTVLSVFVSVLSRLNFIHTFLNKRTFTPSSSGSRQETLSDLFPSILQLRQQAFFAASAASLDRVFPLFARDFASMHAFLYKTFQWSVTDISWYREAAVSAMLRFLTPPRAFSVYSCGEFSSFSIRSDAFQEHVSNALSVGLAKMHLSGVNLTSSNAKNASEFFRHEFLQDPYYAYEFRNSTTLDATFLKIASKALEFLAPLYKFHSKPALTVFRSHSTALYGEVFKYAPRNCFVLKVSSNSSSSSTDVFDCLNIAKVPFSYAVLHSTSSPSLTPLQALESYKGLLLPQHLASMQGLQNPEVRELFKVLVRDANTSNTLSDLGALYRRAVEIQPKL